MSSLVTGLPDADLLDQAFTRAAGAPLVMNNDVRLLRDAENYDAWLHAIHAAKHKIYFENYYICDDETGREFAEALAAKARAGVGVRLVYDWLGAHGRASRRLWRGLVTAGVEVRCYNPPRFDNPLESLHRDHRKMLAVDSQVGFVTGLCVGNMWRGDRERGIEPWRDTGIEVRGPALHDIERAFAQVWAATGAPLSANEVVPRDSIAPAGDVALRVVANAPGTAGIFRLDQLIAAAALRTLWLTDAYFAGVAPYVQALRAAALDGVDVRLLVPGASDIPLLRPLSQAGFRPLLEGGVRVFEWKGPMLHAKTAVADGRWARVGSSNLNIASWTGNYELDVVVEDERFATAMERAYETDLANSTEIVLRPRSRLFVGRHGMRSAHRMGSSSDRGSSSRAAAGGSASRAAAGALRLGRTVGAALIEQRMPEPTEARFIAAIGVLFVGIAIAGLVWPFVIAGPLAVIFIWIAIALLARAYKLRRIRRSRGLPATRVRAAPKEQ